MNRTILTILAGLLVGLVFAAAPTSTAEADEPGTLLVIGDSFTARYNDTPGDPLRGWWSMVSERAGLVPTKAAHSGSGMLMRGQGCTSTTFAERLPLLDQLHPTAVIAAGGRNDFKICRSDGTYRRATTTESQLAIRTFVRDLGNAGDAAGISRSNLYTMTPWGTTYRDDRDVIKGFMKKWSDYYGLTYVDVGYLTEAYTVDGTHPNEAGQRVLRDRVLTRSDLDGKFLP